MGQGCIVTYIVKKTDGLVKFPIVSSNIGHRCMAIKMIESTICEE